MTNPNPNPTVGRAVLVATALALVAAAVVPALVVTDLPDRLAPRWSIGGEPVSAVDTSTLITVSLVLVIITTVALVAVTLDRRERSGGARPLVAGSAALLGAIVGAAVAMIFAANQGASDWREVAGPAGWQVVVIVVVGLTSGTVAAWAASMLPETHGSLRPSTPLDVDEGVQVSWSRSLTAGWPPVVAATCVVIGVGVAIVGELWIGLILIVSGLPVALLTRIEVFADHRGLTVAYGPLGWPHTRVPVDRIRSASAIALVPSEWGGWGYRGSVKLFRRAAVVLRAGDGLRVDLTDGRKFAVSIDDPETGAAVLNREVEGPRRVSATG